MKRFIIRLYLTLLLTAFFVLPTAHNARAAGIIRDAEIENTIRMYGSPLFAMAGLDARSVHVIIVNDSSINAFVAGGQNIFINTGLLMASDTANQVIGVIAHETGHITGGHLARTHDELSRASWQTILAMVLGAAAVVAGSGDVGGAIIAGGQQVAQRNFLKYSRTQESSADQAAFSTLDATGQSAKGLLSFFQMLGSQEALITSNQDPYVRTHPIFSDRITATENHIAKSVNSDKLDPANYQIAHARMRAKLKGFILPPDQTLQTYPKSNISMPAIYARAVAYHRAHQLDDSLLELDQLLAAAPNDPYFNELRGQVLLEHGKATAAVPYYRAAVRALPRESQLMTGLGQTLLATETAADLAEALVILNNSRRLDPRLSSTWRWLAVAYGRNGDIGNAALATAERYILSGRRKDAVTQARRAEQALPAGSPGQLRAQDIIAIGSPEKRQKRPNKRK